MSCTLFVVAHEEIQTWAKQVNDFSVLSFFTGRNKVTDRYLDKPCFYLKCFYAEKKACTVCNSGLKYNFT